MNNVNMANMPMASGAVGGGPMPMMVNNALAASQVQRPPENNRANLNTYIYDYFLREGMYDCARAMLNSEQALNVHKNSPRRDENGITIGNGVGDDPMDTDSKDDVDTKRPSDLPAPNVPNGSDSCFLYEWFCLFWDMLSAQRNKGGVSPHVSSYVAHTQQQSRMRQNQQQELLRQMRPDMYNNMMRPMPNGMQMNQKQPNLARTAMANNQNNPQMQQMQMLQVAKNQMQRDGSSMDGNQNRPASPGSADNAPSPSKRPRLEGSGPFNPQHANMMNGQRPQQGMPGQQGQQVGDHKKASIAHQMLKSNGIDSANLSPEQFRDFQTQPPQQQAKSIQTYSQNLQQHHSQQIPNKQIPNPGGPQGQGSPMMAQGPDSTGLSAYYNADLGAAGGMRPGPGATQGGGSNHALQDYQMQLMLLEQQNKKRLMMARQEQDSIGGIPRDGSGPGGPGGPPGQNGQPFQDTSPQGVRPGASPNPAEQMKRGTPQMNPAGIPSPLPEGAQSRGSPNAMSFIPNGIDPNIQQTFFKGMNGMEGNMVAPMRPPSSHPNQPFNGQMNPQMMARQQGGPQGGPQQMQWQAPNGNGMAPQGSQGPPGPGQGAQQQRAMPPPSAPAPAASANGRTNTSSPQTTTAAPPTPQQGSKAPPKKKDTKGAKSKAAAHKKSAQTAGATPAAEANQEPEPPQPATPITPVNAGFKPGQNAGTAPAAANAPASGPQAASAPVAAPPTDQLDFTSMNSNDGIFNIDFANPLTSDNVLQDFDFDSFLHDGDNDATAFEFNPASFGMEAPGEIGAE
ncbi:hypothetical protein F5Y19DRAFT_493226 [Xylariaceae sp. FL1651]|nr:hypothetical protein F5Y19DRAFT_493226 [Xylariaceae sp. FL1651]